MKKYIAKFEVEVEIEAKNLKDAKEILKNIKFNYNTFGTIGRVKTTKSELKCFNQVEE